MTARQAWTLVWVLAAALVARSLDKGSCGKLQTLLVHTRRFVEFAVLHDGENARAVLQDAHVGKRVAIDQQKIRQVAFANETELIAHAHDLGRRSTSIWRL